jgi:hypothetical protein
MSFSDRTWRIRQRKSNVMGLDISYLLREQGEARRRIVQVFAKSDEMSIAFKGTT